MDVVAPRLEDVAECWLGVPEGHKHLRLALRYGDRVLILPEAAVAAIARAYITVQTHPRRRALHLRLEHVPDARDGYAEWQLLETEAPASQVEERLAVLLRDAGP